MGLIAKRRFQSSDILDISIEYSILCFLPSYLLSVGGGTFYEETTLLKPSRFKNQSEYQFSTDSDVAKEP